MVDEVEIKNVGGRYGVASEATLAALVASLNSGGSSRDRVARLESLARNNNTRSLNQETKQRGILGKTLGGLASSAGGLIKEFAVGGNRMSDFSQAVFGAESSITGLVRAVDGLIDNYRELTSVGASFNNSMFDFVKSAAQTGMSLSEYGGFILQNTDKLKNLGGTVTEGAKRFGDISKILRNNFGKDLTRVGMTMGEMNDILIEYTEYSVARMGKETRSNSQLARGAQQYALELDKLSKLTGISRKQLAEDQRKQLSDQRVRVAMDRMSETQQQNLTSNLTFVGSYSENLAEMLKDMIDNTPDSEDTRYLMTASNTFRRLSKDIENMSVEEIAEFTAAVGREVDTFSKLHPNMDQLAGWSNIFGLGPELAALSELSAEERKKRLAEIAKEDAVTAALLNFELALNNVKTFILDQFLALGPDISALATELFDLTGVSDEAGSTFEALKNYARDLIADGFALLKVEIQEFTDYLKAGGDPVEYLKEGLKNVASAVYDWFKELFFGASKEIDTPAGKKTVDDLTKPGLVANMVNAFNNFWEGPYGQAIADTVTGYFKVLLDKMQDMLADWIPGLDKSQSYYEDIQTRYEAGTATPEEREELAARIQREDAQRVADDVNASIVEGLGPILGTIYEYTPLTETSQYYGARMGQGISNWWNETSPEDIIERGYATGTSGFEDFGRESAAKLHGVEAVVPRNTQAGDFLSKYFTDDWRAKAQPAQPVATNNNQEAVTKQLSQLNNTMALVLSELKINNDLNKKTISSVKGLSGDLYRGV